jgi:hypothetical protein
LFGQLKTLASDHTPMMIMRTTVPSVYDWVRRLEDSSGIQGEWHGIANMRPAVSDMLRFCASYYLPFLQANAQAYDTGNDEVSLHLAGQRYAQPTFKYQVKCYSRLKRLLANTNAPGLREVLSDTGCLSFLE